MIAGSCLCGAVRFEVARVPLMSHCHCSKCRKANGGAFRTGATAPVGDFRWVAGGDQVEHYRTPSGYTRSFCRVCGCIAPLVSKERGLVSIPAGLFDDDPGSRPALHMFVGSKAPWWEIADDLPQFEEWVPGYGPGDE